MVFLHCPGEYLIILLHLMKESLYEQFINESPGGLFVENNGIVIDSNQAFLELIGYHAESADGLSIEKIFTAESYNELLYSKKRILKNRCEALTIRNHDKFLKANMIRKDGRCIAVLILIVPPAKCDYALWIYQVLEMSVFMSGMEYNNKLYKLKDYLLDISLNLSQLKDLQNFYTLVLDAAIASIDSAESGIILRYNGDDSFEIAASIGCRIDNPSILHVPSNETFFWQKFKRIIDRTAIINNLHNFDGRGLLQFCSDPDCKSVIETPIFVNDEFYGVIIIMSSEERVFSEDDAKSIEYFRLQLQIALENQLLYNTIEHKANHDPMTDVASRGAFEEQVRKFLKNRYEYESCSIVLMDINDLKTVNDVWGHSAGDKLIIKFISVLKSNLRGTDLLARLGGDEFAICFFSSQSAQFIERLSEIQKNLVDNPLVMPDGQEIACYFSYGVAYCPEDGPGYEELIKKADELMYRMKKDLKSRQRKNDLSALRQHL